VSALFFDREQEVALEAARQASRVLLEAYGQPITVELKAGHEPVTAADRASNELIVQALRQAFPQDGIVAEESLPLTEQALRDQIERERVWFVDPLDGTKEFLARNGEFAAMIGLAVQGRAQLGVVAVPVTGEIFVGHVGQGAFKLDAQGTRTQLAVSPRNQLSQGRLLLSRSHRPRVLLELADRLAVAEKIACGSVGVKASRLASGEAELYINLYQPGGAKLWDGCAPEALVRGAGGEVSTVLGAPIDYRSTNLELVGGYLATNGHLHAALTSLLGSAASAKGRS
jgi:3'(2'), 5'-bisphosphate nucleotidase